MTGSKLRVGAWAIPVLVAMGFVLHLHRSTGPVAASPLPAPAPTPPQRIAAEAPLPAADSDESEREAFDRLRTEITELRTRVAQREQELRARAAARPAESTPRPPLTDEFLTPEQWRDAGASNPTDLMETILWAGAGGDVARVADLLIYTREAEDAAAALWQKVPPELRPADTDASALIALLATDAVPLKPVTLAGDFPQESGDHLIILQVETDPDAPGSRLTKNLRFVKLQVRQPAGLDGWKVVVTPEVITSLAARLELPKGN